MRTLQVGLVALSALSSIGLAVFGVAASANAEPADLVPYCTGTQTPANSNCRAAPSQVFPERESGLSPDLPFGLNPGSVPAV